MTTVTIGVETLGATKDRMAAAFRGEPQGHFITFSTSDLLWRVLTRERWELLQHIGGQGPLSVEDVAARVGRDQTRVQADLNDLLRAGVLDDLGDCRVEFPYDAIHVDFTVTKAA